MKTINTDNKTLALQDALKQLKQAQEAVKAMTKSDPELAEAVKAEAKAQKKAEAKARREATKDERNAKKRSERAERVQALNYLNNIKSLGLYEQVEKMVKAAQNQSKSK
jgi:membrane protein involved in colicin uptake